MHGQNHIKSNIEILRFQSKVLR